ncbi:FAD-dependent oxidoreductase [Thiobaca trueperi]|uniref:Choline dehydrogenase-like flavoprotein n=1 Tax=Thiobaca trueperi TaxID=127458 RepID=A0A4R3MQW5_9GAMM|nr:GMC family oxidoreductase [Thiobaca trueperi]TCT18700.1 choline dehydrogenase-like flavoprotein [Thiobaca trueperi]
MLHHADTYAFQEAPTFDAIVVGAGAVGLCAAVDMARRGLRVALLEAGAAKPAQSSQKYFEAARAIGYHLPGLHVGRFRCLGGTTSFWGGQLVPFAPIVFTQRPWVTDATWPIGHDDIAPYYERAFHLFGMEQVIRTDDDVWKRLRVVPPPSTPMIQPIFTRWTPEPNFAILFRKEILEIENLHLLLDAQVGALVCDDAGNVSGVELRFANGHRETLRGANVVLANGTIEISRLLLMPLASGAPAPWAENSWIGRGFIDHVDCYAGSVTPIDKKRFSDLFDNAFIDGLKYNPKLRLADEIQEREQLLDISSHFIFNSSMAENIQNLKIVIKGLMKGRMERSALANPLALLRTLHFIVPMAVRYLKYRRIMNLSDGGIQLRLTSEQAPITESRIRHRSGDLDDFGMPQVDVDWKIAPDTVRTLATFGEYVRDYLEQAGLAHVKLDPQLTARDPAYLEKTDDANHQMGGARMAETADKGVVDTSCAVFGTQNLYVAGAAVYPASGFANPSFTAIALGLRLSETLARHAIGATR